MRRLLLTVCLLPLLAGCDQISERLGLPDPAKQEAEGKAMGAACRNAGRGLEDCYQLHAQASKAAIYSGWKEMNEYMMKNEMQSLPPEIPPKGFNLPRHKSPADEPGGDGMDKKGRQEDRHGASK